MTSKEAGLTLAILNPEIPPNKSCWRLLYMFQHNPVTFSAFLSVKRSNCYMVWGGEFSSSQQTRISQEDFVIGCLVDLDTGLMTFTANGKEIHAFYQVR